MAILNPGSTLFYSYLLSYCLFDGVPNKPPTITTKLCTIFISTPLDNPVKIPYKPITKYYGYKTLQYIKLHPTSSTHQGSLSVRLQIPQLSVTAQRKEKKSNSNKQTNEEYNFFYL